MIPGDGNKRGKLIVVGEQPSYMERTRGISFVGPAGSVYTDILQTLKISRQQDVWTTNVIKEIFPLKKIISWDKGYTVENEAMWNKYVGILTEEIQQCSAEVIVPMGGLALYALTGRTGIDRWRGSILDCTLVPGKKVVATYHPATVIPPKNQHLNKRLILMDFTKAWALAVKHLAIRQIITHIDPTAEEALNFLLHVKNEGEKGKLVGHDTEVLGDGLNKHLGCFSIGIDNEVMSIPIVSKYAARWKPSTEREILTIYFQILTSTKIRKVIQNAAFDCGFLFRDYGIVTKNYDDTMIAQQTLMSEYKKSLDFINSLYGTLPYWKEDGKLYIKGALNDEGTFWKYNALDTHAILECLPKQLKDLETTENLAAYYSKLAVVEPCVFIQENGILVNREAMIAGQTAAKEVFERLKEDFIGRTQKSPTSSKQVKELLFDDMGLPPLKSKTGKVSADKFVLQQLCKPTTKRDAVPEAQEILRIRKVQKIASTYLDPDVLDPDSRMRSSINPVGTRFSRLSSGASIYGTGANIQNQPHMMLSLYKPEPGCLFIGPDISQGENRIVAYMAECLPLINAFENDEDAHAVAAKMIMHEVLGPEIAAKTSVKAIAKELGSTEHTWRDYGKKANHSLDYDLGPNNFALIFNLAIRVAKIIHLSFHKGLPEIRGVFHTYVRDQIRRTRFLTNLLGRKTFFAGALVDETYKAGYSCIPQGTIGDLVDRCGMAYLYYGKGHEKVVLNTQVHDQIGFSYPVGDWDGLADVVLGLKSSMERPLKTPFGRQFYLPLDFSFGTSMNKDDPLRSFDLKSRKVPTNRTELANLLEQKYSTLLPPMNPEEFKNAILQKLG